MQVESYDDTIRRGARQIRLQLLAEQLFASSSDVHNNGQQHNDNYNKSVSTKNKVNDYTELLRITTPKETLDKLKELDDLHAQSEMRGLARLRKLQMLEGRIQNSDSMGSGSGSSQGGLNSNQSTSTRSSASGENYSYRQPSIASSVVSSSRGSVRSSSHLMTLDLRPKPKQPSNSNSAYFKANVSSKSMSSSRTRSRTHQKSHVSFDLPGRHEEKQSSLESSLSVQPSNGMKHASNVFADYEQSQSNEESCTPSLQSKYQKKKDLSDSISSLHESRRSTNTFMTKKKEFKAEDDLLTEEHVSVSFPIELQQLPLSADTKKNNNIFMEPSTGSHALLQPADNEDAVWKKSEAYIHAMQSGVLWQTLVGEHVRFPKEWFNGFRTPAMSGEGIKVSKWRYIARNKVRNSSLNKLVRRRGGGRILLHLIVRDAVSQREKEDIVLGCFHPQSRGLITDDEYKCVRDKADIDVRDIWMAFRTRSNGSKGSNLGMSASTEISMTQPLLTGDRCLSEVSHRSPLYSDERLSNENIRAVFGSESPLETLFVLETDLVKVLETNSYSAPRPVAVVLMQKYLFR